MESELKEVRNTQREIEHNYQKTKLPTKSATTKETAFSSTEKTTDSFCDSSGRPSTLLINDCDKNSSLEPTASNKRQQSDSADSKIEYENPNQVQANLEIARLRQHTEELHIKFNLISAAIRKLEFSIDELEQYGHRNCIILHGTSNLPNAHNNYYEFLHKVINTINHHLNLRLNIDCVDIAYPLPPAKSGNIPIIIKFLKRSTRNEIYKRKHLLSKSGLAVTESLTKRRLSLLQEAKSLLGDKNVWSFNGTVFTNINSKREKIVFQEDLYRLVTTIGNPH